jgi:hypothetical protein
MRKYLHNGIQLSVQEDKGVVFLMMSSACGNFDFQTELHGAELEWLCTALAEVAPRSANTASTSHNTQAV